MSSEPHTVGEVVDGMHDLAEHSRKVSVGDLIEEFGDRSFGPFILIPALIEVTPIGGIPGVPTFLALIIAIVALQVVLGRDHLTLPGFVEDRCVKSNKLITATEKLKSISDFFDRLFGERLDFLASGVFARIAGVVIVLLCCTVPPLEFLPFASSAPMLTIAFFGVALLVRDGLLMIVALLLSLGTFAFGLSMLLPGAAG